MGAFLKRLNVTAECREAHLGLWSCPPFLFVVMGSVDIVAMVSSYVLANRYVDPELAALIVMAVTVVVFVIGYFIINGFAQIAEANRIKTEFIAIVSHQLRSPLSIFKWTLDALIHSPAAAAPPPLSLHLGILRENTEKMIQLVNLLLEVSRIESGRFVLRREAVRLDLITEETIRSFAAYATASNVSIEYVTPTRLEAAVGDRERVKMVVQNLIDNAIRYSYGGGRVVVTIAPRDAAMIEWKIRDSGLGIAESEQKNVFQKFFRSERAVLHQAQGTGLGLYITRSIVVALKGKIGYDSVEGKGSTFWFMLPVWRGS